MQDSPITATVDYRRDGVQHGFLKLPYSHDVSAWGSLMIPITVARNGDGPTALLTGGNHGDEYEGVTALLKLAGRLRAEDIRGRVIIVPMMNHPAVLNGTRTSPLDKGNLNRAFPGSPTGTLTQRIADYFTRYLVPLCDLALGFGESGEDMSDAERAKKMSRPYGVALLLAGYDEEGPQLFHSDPSGTYTAYQAKAIGSGAEGAQTALQALQRQEARAERRERGAHLGASFVRAGGCSEGTGTSAVQVFKLTKAHGDTVEFG